MDGHDQKVAELIPKVAAIRQQQPSLSHEEIKKLLTGAGSDDELDLAIVLQEVVPVDWGKAAIKSLVIPIVTLTVILLVVNLLINLQDPSFQLWLFVVIMLSVLFLARNIGYRQAYLDELINHDFGFRVVGHGRAGKYLGMILGVPDDAKVEKILNCIFDGRETFFGYFSWTRRQGKHTTTYNRTFVIQILPKKFDSVILFPQGSFSDLAWGEDVDLESNEFSRKFIVKTGGRPKNAFYTLNPRVMEHILQESAIRPFRFLQVTAEMAAIGYDEVEAGVNLGAKFTTPVITFAEYMKVKEKLKRKLLGVAGLADVLLREKVEQAESS